MTAEEKVSVTLERPGMVIGCADVATAGERTQDGETQAQVQAQAADDIRIGRLKSSIVKIQDQVEQTRKQLDGVCEVLRGSTDDLLTASIATGGTMVDTSTTAQTTNVTNEEVLGRARATVTGHIKMLTRYNELKDVAMMLFELIAEYQGGRVGEVLRERDVEVDD